MATIVAAVVAAKASDAWTKNLGEFIPAPLVWLNQARWDAPAAPTEAQVVQAREAAEATAAVTKPGESTEQYLARKAAEDAAEKQRMADQDPEERARRIAAARAALSLCKAPGITA